MVIEKYKTKKNPIQIIYEKGIFWKCSYNKEERGYLVILELMHSFELYISCFFYQKLFFILCIPSLCYKEKSGCIDQNKGKLLYFSFL